MYVAVLRRVGGSLIKTARRSNSQLFFPDTCFSNTVRTPLSGPRCLAAVQELCALLSRAPCGGAGHLLPRVAKE